MANVTCLRCGQEAPAITDPKPYPGALGENIAKHICQGCWDGWRKFSVNVINDYKLRPFLPQDRAIVEKHMKQYLNLEIQPLTSHNIAQNIVLTGQGKNATFDTSSSVSKEKVVEMLEQIYDPEIPVNINDLGLIYDIAVAGGQVKIKMTLTSQHCPAAQSLPASVKEAVSRIAGVKDVSVEIVWDPPWSKDKISPEGRQILGL